MAQQIFRTVVGNSSPDLVITCKRNDTAIDLAGATSVSLFINNERTGLVTNTGHQTCTITTAASGIITYTPQTTDWPSEGRYTGDVKIIHSGARPEYLYELLLIIARPANS